MKNDNPDKHNVPYWWLLVAFCVVVVLWGATWFFLAPLEATDRGTFGDMFGVVNALFSGLAFATLIYTMFLQREELRLQRIELQATRDEMKGQKEQLEAQSFVFRKQAFEDTFFRLLDHYDKLTRAIHVAPHKSERLGLTAEWNGREAFHYIYKVLELEYKRICNEDTQSALTEGARITQAVQYLITQYGNCFTAHSEILVPLVKFVDSYEPALKDRTYVQALAAYMSAEEKAIVFYLGAAHVQPNAEHLFARVKLFFVGLKPLSLLDKSHADFYKSE